MSNPNPNIWGAPETWLNAKGYWQGGENNGNSTIKAERAKIANFGGNNDEYVGSLGRAYDNNIIELAPIDNTIVSCGQNPTASAYGTIKLFKNKQSEELNVVPDKVITQINPINWFFYYMSGYNYASANTMTRYGKVDFNNAKMRIYPNAEAGTKPNNYNPNLLITPIVHYQIRSIWSVIWVQLDNNTYGGGTWCTLEDWKNNYSSQPIRNINMDIFGYSSDNGTTVTYSRSANLNDGEANNVAFMGDIDGINCYTAFTFERAPVITVANSIDYNYYNTDFTFVAVGWRDDWENSTIKSYVRENTSHGWCVWQSVPYTAANYEKIMQMAACFGVPFSDSNYNTIPIDFNANYVCLPVIDENGIATGEYTRGTDNLTNPFAQLDSVRDTNYDPDKYLDPNTYSNITGFNSVSGGASMTKRYVLDKANVDKLADDLWTITDALALEGGQINFNHLTEKVIENFLCTNPIDCIVSLKRFPFEVPHTFSNTKTAVKLGKSDATAQGYATYNIFNTVVFTGINIYPRFENSFLDYSPYTEYELYVPFCGTIKLNAGDILGHTLNCRLQIDLLTGACTAYIMADGLVIETATGNCACELQVTGTDATYMNSAITGAITSAKTGKLNNITTSWQPLSIGGALSTVANPWKQAQTAIGARYEREQAEYNLQHLQTPVHSMGTASALTGWYQEFNARLIIYYPTGDAVTNSIPPALADLSTYAHTTGFATVANDVLNNYSGLTVATNPILNFAATATEKEMISAALQGGVFI